MKKTFKILFIICLISSCVIGLGRFYFSITDGFSRSNITSEFAHREGWHEPIMNVDDTLRAKEILRQPFHYLARGAQSYAFESEDHRYVLKLVKQKHLKFNFWDRLYCSLPFTGTLREEKLSRREQKIRTNLESSQISFENLKNETALVYLHLKPTSHLNQKVTITDKLGFHYSLDLDTTEFFLQEKAELALPYLTGLLNKGKREEARKALIELVKLRREVASRGIRDRDTKFLDNTGFLNGHAIIIDTGQFVWDETIKDPNNFQVDIKRKTAEFQLWLKKSHPDLAIALEESIINES